jgi:hypothetical protein
VPQSLRTLSLSEQMVLVPLRSKGWISNSCMRFRFAAREPSAERKELVFQISARLKSGPDTCVAVVTHCDQGRIKLSPLNPAGEGRAFGVAAYGAPLLLLKSTQGLRAWARLFRASGAGV